jgi:hypothetical protein
MPGGIEAHVLDWYDLVDYRVWMTSSWTPLARTAIDEDPPDDQLVVTRRGHEVWIARADELVPPKPPKPPCKIEGCGQSSTTGGFCEPHYKREWRLKALRTSAREG